MNIPTLSDWSFKEKREVAWTTDNEKVFIDRIGTYSAECSDMGRRHLLRQYRIAIQKRCNWEGIDRDAVLDYLEAAQRRLG